MDRSIEVDNAGSGFNFRGNENTNDLNVMGKNSKLRTYTSGSF